jgi:hypothetical protein
MGPAQNALWSAQLQGSQFPYTALPSLLGGTYSTPLVTPDQGFNTQAALGGALAGGLGAAGLYDRYAQPSPPTTNIYNQPYGGSTYQNPNTLQFWGSDVYE